MRKPMLACDYDETKLKFPIGIQPKIDGVRALTTEGYLTGRSLKKHKNLHVTKIFSQDIYKDMDGEMTVGRTTAPDLCRTTSGSLSRITGYPDAIWWVFDLLEPEVISLPYETRWNILKQRVLLLESQGITNIKLVTMTVCNNLKEVQDKHQEFLDLGYEGSILRDLKGKHKQGRATVSKGDLLRIKDFISAEGKVVSFNEAQDNNNEAQTNELGRTFRSSHQENKQGNGMIGNIDIELTEDVKYEGKVLFKKNQVVTIGPGKLDHTEREYLYDNPDELIDHIVTFKFFPKGIKDKPRFPTYVSHRSNEDISED